MKGSHSKIQGLILALVVLPSIALRAGVGFAAEIRCDDRSDPAATQLMSAIEQIRRTNPRLLRMHIKTRYGKNSRLAEISSKPPSPKILWGAVSGSSSDTWMLYVFSGPGRMAGTSLLIRDQSGTEAAERAEGAQGSPGEAEREGREESESRDIGDSAWFYLSAFENFERLHGDIERTYVPSTALTYEDARGYFSIDKYRFRTLEGQDPSQQRILACPRSARLAERLGYSFVLLDIDPARKIVLRVDYRDVAGAPLKSYELVESIEFLGKEFPSRVKLEHSVEGFRNEITYEYWAEPEAGVPTTLLRPDLESGTFLARMRAYVHAVGLGKRIDAELAEADRIVKIHDEKFAQPAAEPTSPEKKP